MTEKNLKTIVYELFNQGFKEESYEMYKIACSLVKLAKFQAKMPNKHKSPPKGYPQQKPMYLDEKNFKYPIDTEKHVRAALSYLSKPSNQKFYSESELKNMFSKLHKRCKHFGIEVNNHKTAQRRWWENEAGEPMYSPEAIRAEESYEPEYDPDQFLSDDRDNFDNDVDEEEIYELEQKFWGEYSKIHPIDFKKLTDMNLTGGKFAYEVVKGIVDEYLNQDDVEESYYSIFEDMANKALKGESYKINAKPRYDFDRHDLENIFEDFNREDE